MYAACAEYQYSQRFVTDKRKFVDGEVSIDTPSQRNKPGSELDFPLSNGAAECGLASAIRQNGSWERRRRSLRKLCFLRATPMVNQNDSLMESLILAQDERWRRA